MEPAQSSDRQELTFVRTLSLWYDMDAEWLDLVQEAKEHFNGLSDDWGPDVTVTRSEILFETDEIVMKFETTGTPRNQEEK